MKQIFITLVLVFVSSLVNAEPDSLTLLQCMAAARSHAKIKPQIEIYDEIAELEIEGRRAGNFPSLSAYGKAWYQNDAITVTTAGGPGLEIDRFQYNFGLEAKQKIYDGGIARKGKELDKASINAEISRVETELYQLNDLVVDFFF
jgi:outer membrane protein TolC